MVNIIITCFSTGWFLCSDVDVTHYYTDLVLSYTVSASYFIRWLNKLTSTVTAAIKSSVYCFPQVSPENENNSPPKGVMFAQQFVGWREFANRLFLSLCLSRSHSLLSRNAPDVFFIHCSLFPALLSEGLRVIYLSYLHVRCQEHALRARGTMGKLPRAAGERQEGETTEGRIVNQSRPEDVCQDQKTKSMKSCECATSLGVLQGGRSTTSH